MSQCRLSSDEISLWLPSIYACFPFNPLMPGCSPRGTGSISVYPSNQLLHCPVYQHWPRDGTSSCCITISAFFGTHWLVSFLLFHIVPFHSLPQFPPLPSRALLFFINQLHCHYSVIIAYTDVLSPLLAIDYAVVFPDQPYQSHLPLIAIIYQVEHLALLLALHGMFRSPFCAFVIFTNSHSALHSSQNFPTVHLLVLEKQE